MQRAQSSHSRHTRTYSAAAILLGHLVKRASFVTGSEVSDDLVGEELTAYLTATLEGQDAGCFASLATQDDPDFGPGEESIQDPRQFHHHFLARFQAL